MRRKKYFCNYYLRPNGKKHKIPGEMQMQHKMTPKRRVHVGTVLSSVSLSRNL